MPGEMLVELNQQPTKILSWSREGYKSAIQSKSWEQIKVNKSPGGDVYKSGKVAPSSSEAADL
jgi:hypothetical protein